LRRQGSSPHDRAEKNCLPPARAISASSFVVGEERNSAGAIGRAATPRGSRFLINGEPTENRLALGSKGALRYEITTHGKPRTLPIPNSAFRPSTRCSMFSATFARFRLPRRLLGRSTLNSAPSMAPRTHVVADHAEAEIMFRTIAIRMTREACPDGDGSRAEARRVFYTPAVQWRSRWFAHNGRGFTTDIPSFEGTWGSHSSLPRQHSCRHTSESASEEELSEAVILHAHGDPTPRHRLERA